MWEDGCGKTGDRNTRYEVQITKCEVGSGVLDVGCVQQSRELGTRLGVLDTSR